MPLISTSSISSSRRIETKTPRKTIITLLLRATTITAISKQTTLLKGASICIQTLPLLSRIRIKQLKNTIKRALSLLMLKKQRKITSFQLLYLLLQEYPKISLKRPRFLQFCRYREKEQKKHSNNSFSLKQIRQQITESSSTAL